ncbi:MAG: hypothetical protein KDC14_05265 [Planctomycetes bacterium]|nr:hypothetical protein [Planctomycetota bacterium]
MTRAALALALLAGCGPYAGPAAGQGWRWRTEPTVGPSTPELAPLVAHAVDAWGYGRVVESCDGADVCVIRGQRSHAGRVGDRCVAEVALSAIADPPPGVWRVVEHEIGHCYGLPHIDDPGSVMHPGSPTSQGVSDADRAALRRVQR